MPPNTIGLPLTDTKPKTTVHLDLVVASDDELEKPYRVIIENDDVTPMDFVVFVLQVIFELTFPDAERVMMTAHTDGHAHVVTLPYQEAQQRVYIAQHLAREQGYPLSFYLEPDA